MNTKSLGWIALACLLATVIWLSLYIYGAASSEPITSTESAVAFSTQAGSLFYLTYLNAALVTFTATLLFTGLYIYLRPVIAGWAEMGMVFVPVYSAINLFAYLSQITIVPRLAASIQATRDPGTAAILGQLTQQWPGSAVNIVNNLGYAVLGFPSILFGAALLRKNQRSLHLAGGMLIFSGTASIAGFAGIILQHSLLEFGSIAGGGFFLFALIALSLAFLKGNQNQTRPGMGTHPT